MRVYAETNFLLEIAYRQAAFRPCVRLLSAAERGDVELLIPAVCFPEAAESLLKRLVKRTALGRRVKDEVKNAARSAHPLMSAFERDADEVVERMIQFAQRELQRSERCRARCVSAACVLSTGTRAVELSGAIELRPEEVVSRRPRGFGRTDAAILAAVVADLEARPAPDAIFVTTDAGLREHPVTAEALAAAGCGVGGNFAGVVRRAVAAASS